jgi:hypothetical protein
MVDLSQVSLSETGFLKAISSSNQRRRFSQRFHVLHEKDSVGISASSSGFSNMQRCRQLYAKMDGAITKFFAMLAFKSRTLPEWRAPRSLPPAIGTAAHRRGAKRRHRGGAAIVGLVGSRPRMKLPPPHTHTPARSCGQPRSAQRRAAFRHLPASHGVQYTARRRHT